MVTRSMHIWHENHNTYQNDLQEMRGPHSEFVYWLPCDPPTQENDYRTAESTPGYLPPVLQFSSALPSVSCCTETPHINEAVHV